MLVSPLRYPGGKAKLYSYFVRLINVNGIHDVEYCEPYAGGAGLAIRLLETGFVERVSINDIDQSIVAFWRSILENTLEFCSLIQSTPITVDEWHRQKEIWRAGDVANILELGFSAYFLNRTNRSGIIDGAGPIGGFDQRGEWKIDARFIKDRQIENILSLSKYRSQIEVSNIDALEFISDTLNRDNSLTYLDPPYFVKGKKLYKNAYKRADHARIAEFLGENREARWVVSYDDVPEIREEYRMFEPLAYSLSYSAGPKTSGKEVMYLSDALRLPQGGFRLAA